MRKERKLEIKNMVSISLNNLLPVIDCTRMSDCTRMFVHAIKGEELSSDKETNTQLTGENGKQYGDSSLSIWNFLVLMSRMLN